MTNIIYLPGLGDGFDGWRQFALRGWNSSKRRAVLVPMLWDETGDTLSDKLDRIKQVIDDSDGPVVLVGESAGGPVALIAGTEYSERVDRIVTLCGMNQHAEAVRPGLYAKHPAFREAMLRADEVTAAMSEAEKRQIDIFYSIHDMTVSPKHTLLDGVRLHPVSIPGHMLTISLLLTVLRWRVIASIK